MEGSTCGSKMISSRCCEDPSGSGVALDSNEERIEGRRPARKGMSSHGCRNKRTPLGGLNQRTCCLTVQKVSSPSQSRWAKSECWQGHIPPGGSREASGLFQGGCWPHSSAADPASHFLCIPRVSCLLPIRILVITQDLLIIQNDLLRLLVLNLLTSMRRLSPYKVVSWGSDTNTVNTIFIQICWLI